MERRIDLFITYVSTSGSLATLAAQYGVSRSTVRSAVRRALQQVRLLQASN